MKTKTLNNKTEELTTLAGDYSKTFRFACELEDISDLIKLMAFHIRDLQSKVNNQAEQLTNLQGKKKGEQK